MKLLVAVLAVFAFAGCAAPGPSPTVTPSPTAELAAWRLVAAADRSSEWAYSVHAAKSDAEWSALWGQLSPGLAEPAIDFGREFAAVFADGSGGPGNCSERRLDGVVIDVQTSLIYAEISDPLAPRNCDAMLGGSSIFVVAIARSSLPLVPFTLRLGRTRTCGDCPDQITVDLR
jgi:hypothetical protein